MGRPRVEELKALAEIGMSRVVIAPPAFDAEGLTRGLEKLQRRRDREDIDGTLS